MFLGMAVWVLSVVKVSSAYGYYIGGNDPNFTLKSILVIAVLSLCMLVAAASSAYVSNPSFRTFGSRHVT